MCPGTGEGDGSRDCMLSAEDTEHTQELCIFSMLSVEDTEHTEELCTFSRQHTGGSLGQESRYSALLERLNSALIAP